MITIYLGGAIASFIMALFFARLLVNDFEQLRSKLAAFDILAIIALSYFMALLLVGVMRHV